MPVMFRPHGVRKFFRSIDEGRREGYFQTYNEMAQAYKAQQGDPVPAQPAPDASPPVPPVVDDGDEYPRPHVPPDSLADHDSDQHRVTAEEVETLPLSTIKEMAEQIGLDTTQHHKTLRKQVREAVNAQEIGDH